MTKLASTLPGHDAHNGIEALSGTLTANPDASYLVVCVLDVKRITTDMDTHEQTATVRVQRIEPVLPKDQATVISAMLRAQEHRLGKTALPIPAADDKANLMASINLETGEIIEDTGGIDDE